MSGPPWTAARFGWETAQLAGAVGVVAALVLLLKPVRPRTLRPAPMTLARHELIGWVVLGASALHVLLVLSSDRTAREHLKPTLPLYEAAGALALCALLFLTVFAVPAVRVRLWPRHRLFQGLHVSVAAVLIALLAMHVLTTARYVRGLPAVMGYIAVSAAALLGLLRPRPRAPPRGGFSTRLVFGRYALPVMLATLTTAAVSAALVSAPLRLRLRESLAVRAARLPLEFPHERHRAVNCLTCHHNFADDTGAEACVTCHRRSTPALQVQAEARFHDFCLGCHRDPPPPLTRHGPVTGCDSCHEPKAAAAVPAG